MDSTTTSTGTGTSTGTASYTYTINPSRQYGWVCPLCGRANAPWISQCPCMPTTTWSGPIWSSSEWTFTPDHTTITN